MRKPMFLVSLLWGAFLPDCRRSSDSAPVPPASPPAAVQKATSLSGHGSQGVITGQVRLSGTPPVPEMRATTPAVASVCGDAVPDRSLTVGDAGGLAFVVVALVEGAGLPADGVVSPSPMLDQRKCAYEPPVLAARAGATLEVRNSDPVMHNVRAVSGAQPLFNVAMPLEGTSLRRPLPAAPATLQVKCDVHPWMRAVVRTFDHPYFTTTDANGRFRLEVPEGTHTLLFWHPRLPEATHALTVQAGQTQQVEQSWPVSALR
ncbi:carboxypeptidase regulatory-like domain-containing protein [Stigmatella sp. ncwal1]|uniref:Carboxypeptidase regulatory-like domain-containing protein n=1 Tax=Stigmatella ashevillensis TaxID=2995309 RepID=A0ABT5D7T6_9BACT|nr:carboxypeptidase regulatory-like domain-containing protein [Stigmatella ashevillena]MDC0709720.1 carboxypeptidase regulatory-like domain-containing protein [Stigmatella ashevillena]